MGRSAYTAKNRPYTPPEPPVEQPDCPPANHPNPPPPNQPDPPPPVGEHPPADGPTLVDLPDILGAVPTTLEIIPDVIEAVPPILASVVAAVSDIPNGMPNVLGDVPILNGLDGLPHIDLNIGNAVGVEAGSNGIDVDLSPGHGSGGNGVGLIGLKEGGNELINIPVFSADGSVANDVGSLINSAMLGDGGNNIFNLLGSDAYDGNGPLLGGDGLSSLLGNTLEMLTTTEFLYDVPAIDIALNDVLDS